MMKAGSDHVQLLGAADARKTQYLSYFTQL